MGRFTLVIQSRPNSESEATENNLFRVYIHTRDFPLAAKKSLVR